MKSAKVCFGAWLIGAAGVTGCAGQAQTTGYAEVEAPAAPVVASEPPPVVADDTPMLVTVEPDVWVVRDSEVPVYYVDDYYWAYRGGVWQRSHEYGTGWVTVEASIVPPRIVHRDHSLYVHYHGAANAVIRPAPRVHLAAEDMRAREAQRREIERRDEEQRAAEQREVERREAERAEESRRREHGGGPVDHQDAQLEARRRAEQHQAEMKKAEERRKEEERKKKAAEKRDRR
jgi:hypothetical protein